MTIFEKIKYLADRQKISINDLEDRLGFSRNVLYSWKKKTPTITNLQKVADYFQISLDYLTDRTAIPTILNVEILSEYEKKAKQLRISPDDIRTKLNSSAYNEKLNMRVQALNEIITLFDLPNSEETKQEILFFLLELKNRTK